jgi:hypothetical protein
MRSVDNKILVGLLVLAALGAVLLGKGITGMVALGHSCCFGPDCPADSLCDVAEPHLESPSRIGYASSAWIGVVVLVGALYMVHHHARKS